MSLQGSRIKSGLDPWLRVRIQYLEDITLFNHGTFLYFSGARSIAEQAEIFESRIFRPRRPVAQPGCSQHNVGWAVDVGIFGPLETEDFTTDEFTRAVISLGQEIGLVTVARDPGHFQIYPGAEYRAAAESAGICPDPGWIADRLRREALQDLREDRGFGPIDTFGSNFFRRGFVF